MLKDSLRTTDKQRHVNRKNLRTRILNHDGDSFEIDGIRDSIVNRFGPVQYMDGQYVIVLKGEAYKIEFNKTNATIYTKPIDVPTRVTSRLNVTPMS